MSRLKFCVVLLLILLCGCRSSQREDPFMSRRQQMVAEQIADRGIQDQRVLEAMREIERHQFVPFYLRHEAYEDHPVPIGYGQTISQPFIVAFMTEALRLESGDKVLEIGTGSGYQAAVLAELVRAVYSIEILKPLADSAQERLAALGYDNVTIKHGDGYLGWPEQAPFDAVIVTAAPPEIPVALKEQLAVGGRMIIPVREGTQELLLLRRTETGYEQTSVLPVRFVPMVKGGHPHNSRP